MKTYIHNNLKKINLKSKFIIFLIFFMINIKDFDAINKIEIKLIRYIYLK